MSFAVFTDTSANLPSPLAAAREIGIVPFSYYVKGEEFNCLDTESFDGDAYYESIRNGLEVSTSQVPPQRFVDHFEPLLQAGKDVLFVSLSSGVSGSCNSARMAARQLQEDYPQRQVVVVDTLGASLGEGMVALKAADCRDAGMSLADTLSVLERMVRRLCQVFTVDNLMHLRRTGRLSNFSAVVGTVLQIKPILIGNPEGKIVAIAKLRGRKRSIEELAARYEQLVEEHEKALVCIAHAGCRQDAEYLVSLLNQNKPPREILLVDYEPVTGSHVGPGALALFFNSNRDDVREMDK